MDAKMVALAERVKAAVEAGEGITLTADELVWWHDTLRIAVVEKEATVEIAHIAREALRQAGLRFTVNKAGVIDGVESIPTSAAKETIN